jgi:hypothetical protein
VVISGTVSATIIYEWSKTRTDAVHQGIFEIQKWLKKSNNP